MTAKNFAAANKRVRVYEGGNVDDPKDPGGRTSRGITQRVYDAYRKSKGLDPRDVFKASETEVNEIYRRQYWDAVKGDQLPSGVDLVVYDGAVNSGPKQSIKWLQAALNARMPEAPPCIVDGALGLVTMEALAADNDHDLLIAEICARRLGFLKRLATWGRFGKGWQARVTNVMKAGQALATGSVGPAPVEVAEVGGGAKALETAIARPAISAGAGTATSGAGITLAGVSDAVNQAAGQASVLSDVSETLKWFFIVLTVFGILITLSAVYSNYRARHALTADARADVEEPPEEVAA